jgi:hypothetical protein
MKVFRIKDHYQKESDEYVLGPHELGNEIGYMVWGEIGPGEKKLLKPGSGHEEIILVIDGEAALENGGGVISKGEAFYLESGESVLLWPADGVHIRRGACARRRPLALILFNGYSHSIVDGGLLDMS